MDDCRDPDEGQRGGARGRRLSAGHEGLSPLSGLSRPEVEAAASPGLTFCIYEPLPGRRVRGGELLLHFGDIFRVQVVEQTLTDQIVLQG